jgi:alkylated DNA repair protein (DNA oxidative demethylase)
MARNKIVRVNQLPEGLFYIPSFLTEQEEADLLENVSKEQFEPYDYHGYLAKREIVFYGPQGGYNARNDDTAGPVPDWIKPFRSKCCKLLGLSDEELAMALVARYPVGAGIGWHRDAPQFGPTVIGVSFSSDADMRFRRFHSDREEIFRIKLQRSSAYIMSGPARAIWQHGMAPVKELRYSITFRTIRDRTRTIDDSRHLPVNIAERLATLNLKVLQADDNQISEQLSLFKEASSES